MKFWKMKNNLLFLKSIFLSKLKSTPYKLNFAITSACNSRCLTCNVGRIFQKNPEVIKNDLKTEEIGKLFDSLPPTITWLSFSGGEPFLRQDLVDIISLAILKIPSLSVISIPSNGLSTQRIIATVKTILNLDNLPQFFLNFSIDGPPEIHDKIRGVQGGYKKTWSTYEAIKELSQKNNKLRVNLEITISQLNLNSLIEFCEELVKNNEKVTITIAHHGFLYKNENLNSILVNKDQIHKIRRIISIINKSLSWLSPPELVEKLYLGKIVDYLINPQNQVLPCQALSTSFAISPQGEMAPCFMWGEKLGNVKKTKVMKIWRSSHTQRIRQLIKLNNCPNCWTPCEAYQSIIWTFLTGRWNRL